jgi:L-galactose dehydrogenase
MSVPSLLTLNDIGLLGLGTASFGGYYGHISSTSAIDKLIKLALHSGINFFDTAPWYLESESILGNALLASNVSRDKYMIATKCGRYPANRPGGNVNGDFDYSASRIVCSIQQSLALLHTTYLDIVYLHDVEFVPISVIIEEALPALVSLKQQGIIRFIGIAGYPLSCLNNIIMKCSSCIDIVQSYCHLTFFNDQLLSMALEWSHKYNIVVSNASPLGMGLLSDSGPQDWHPASELLRSKCILASQLSASKYSIPLSNLATKYSLYLARKANITNKNIFIVTTVIGCLNEDELKLAIDNREGVIGEEEFVQFDEIKRLFFDIGNLNCWHS